MFNESPAEAEAMLSESKNRWYAFPAPRFSEKLTDTFSRDAQSWLQRKKSDGCDSTPFRLSHGQLAKAGVIIAGGGIDERSRICQFASMPIVANLANCLLHVVYASAVGPLCGKVQRRGL